MNADDVTPLTPLDPTTFVPDSYGVVVGERVIGPFLFAMDAEEWLLANARQSGRLVVIEDPTNAVPEDAS